VSQIVINGNNIDILKTYSDNYFDAVVTDPPYGLGKEPNAAELMKDWVEFGYHEIKGTGFMGKEWDAFVPQPVFWNEVYRILKPGGHVLSFFGTRTYDWGVMSMRFAGFEVRDCIQWLYGSGFPKSHNIGKALDKLKGAEREVIGVSTNGMSDNAMKPNKGWNANNMGKNIKITSPATEDAKQWDGWGSALKPSNEPIVLARKPLEKGLSIAENILKWGVGGINIDASRIGTNEIINFVGKRGFAVSAGQKLNDNGTHFANDNFEQHLQGRFPANIILDEIAAEILDEQSGISKSSKSARLYINDTEGRSVKNGASGFRDPNSTYGDKGGASRFFYVAKASKSERNKGLEKNFHPTVKPIKLMQYLVKMITPPNGIVLDPFCGSGTTGVACKIEGLDFVGMEQDPEYYKIAQSRINNYIESPDDYEEEIENKIQIVKKNIKPQLTLF
jgi:site-specific DNA-methyltransferase (adenine-specific)